MVIRYTWVKVKYLCNISEISGNNVDANDFANIWEMLVVSGKDDRASMIFSLKAAHSSMIVCENTSNLFRFGWLPSAHRNRDGLEDIGLVEVIVFKHRRKYHCFEFALSLMSPRELFLKPSVGKYCTLRETPFAFNKRESIVAEFRKF
ncbi:hypothetical protein JTB14_019154 [Gonioctena quinquepunctata]|nr:hypothetical protein JTB14_019154 [Gonioctena quinquepunctata]